MTKGEAINLTLLVLCLWLITGTLETCRQHPTFPESLDQSGSLTQRQNPLSSNRLLNRRYQGSFNISDHRCSYLVVWPLDQMDSVVDQKVMDICEPVFASGVLAVDDPLNRLVIDRLKSIPELRLSSSDREVKRRWRVLYYCFGDLGDPLGGEFKFLCFEFQINISSEIEFLGRDIDFTSFGHGSSLS